MKIIKILVLLPLLALATGCASITRGSNDSLEVNSTPAQADIKVYRTNAGFTAKEIKNNTVADPENPGAGPLIGKTPTSFKLARKGEYKVVISREGYKTTEVEIGNRLGGAGKASLAGNALAGGLIGILIDSRTGAAKDLTPNPVEVALETGEGTIIIALPKKKEKADDDEEVEAETDQATEDAAPSIETVPSTEEVIKEAE